MCVACFGESRKRGDEEAEQIQVPWWTGAKMDLSDSWRGCWCVQLHAPFLQTEPHEGWIRRLEQCLIK